MAVLIPKALLFGVYLYTYIYMLGPLILETPIRLFKTLDVHWGVKAAASKAFAAGPYEPSSGCWLGAWPLSPDLPRPMGGSQQ